jgi:general secretion pathway protein G
MNTRIQHPVSRIKYPAKGFTLVEMVLVLGIIGLLVGAGIYNLTGVLDKGKNKRVKADITTFTAALGNYEMASNILPSTEQGLMALVEKPSGRPQPQGWSPCMKKLQPDPWGNPYLYRRPATKDKGPYDVYSAGPDGIPDTADDIGNWDL